MMSDLKLYRNKQIREFTSIPQKISDDSSQLDTIYLASHFDKLRTKSVAAIRKSKHYASTINAWEKKLTGVDTSDLAAVAKTLGFDVEVFNPLSSSEPKTLYSGGGRSKRKAQLLKVKKGVFKPMKAGSPSRETYEQGLEASSVSVGGRANVIDVDLNADSRGAAYGEDDAALAKAIEVLFAKMKNLEMKKKLCATLK